MKSTAMSLALMLAVGCATKRPADVVPVPVPVKPLESLPVCSLYTGELWLPDPCRYEVSPGEWMRVETPKLPPKKHKPWWLLLLLL